MKRRGKILKGSIASNGYQSVVFRKGGKRHYVHRLVAAAFLGNVEGMEVDHLNKLRADNRVENLEIITKGENMKRSHNGNQYWKKRKHHHNQHSTA